MAGHLKKDVFPEFNIGLLHGRMKTEEKEAVMRDFKEGRINILVSTTVIEVGIDVSNASEGWIGVLRPQPEPSHYASPRIAQESASVLHGHPGPS